MRTKGRLLVVSMFAALPAASAQPFQGALIGFVSARASGEPISYADVAITARNVAAFTDARGRFHIVGMREGTVHLIVRRLGYRPTSVAVTISARGVDTVRVELVELALNLERIAVSEPVCPSGGSTRSDTAVVAILEQVHLNAQRSAVLAREYPFELESERTFADEIRDGARMEILRKRTILRVDTVTWAGEHAWQYRPGQLVVPVEREGPIGGMEKLRIPQLADFADEHFLASHCFRYAGRERVEGRDVVRVDFDPIKEFQRTDIRGSLYLDANSYAIRRSTFFLERPSPRAPGRDIWDVRVDTWFVDVTDGLSRVDRILQVTTVRGSNTANRVSRQAATELQRTINLRFLGRVPGERNDPHDD